MSQISSSAIIEHCSPASKENPTELAGPVHAAAAQPRHHTQPTREPAPNTHTHVNLRHTTHLYAFNPPPAGYEPRRDRDMGYGGGCLTAEPRTAALGSDACLPTYK